LVQNTFSNTVLPTMTLYDGHATTYIVKKELLIFIGLHA